MDVIKNEEATVTQTLPYYTAITIKYFHKLKMQLYVKTQDDRNFHSMGTFTRNTTQNGKTIKLEGLERNENQT